MNMFDICISLLKMVLNKSWFLIQQRDSLHSFLSAEGPNQSDKTFLSLITSEEVGHKLNITSIDAPLKNTLQSSNKNKMYLTLLGAISFRLFLLLWKY